MNKKYFVIIGCALLVLIGFIFYFVNTKIVNRLYKPGIEKIATQSIAIIYHPYNEGIREIANIIHSRVGGDVITLEPLLPYSNDQLQKDRIIDEQKHPEKVIIKENKFDLKKYHIIFIGIPVIESDTSPIMKKFLIENERLFSKNTITIPFIFYNAPDSTREVQTFFYYKTLNTIRKNGYISSNVNKRANEMYIDIWMKDLSFYRPELERPTKEKLKEYKSKMAEIKAKEKARKELLKKVNGAPAVPISPNKPAKKP